MGRPTRLKSPSQGTESRSTAQLTTASRARVSRSGSNGLTASALPPGSGRGIAVLHPAPRSGTGMRLDVVVLDRTHRISADCAAGSADRHVRSTVAEPYPGILHPGRLQFADVAVADRSLAARPDRLADAAQLVALRAVRVDQPAPVERRLERAASRARPSCRRSFSQAGEPLRDLGDAGPRAPEMVSMPAGPARRRSTRARRWMAYLSLSSTQVARWTGVTVVRPAAALPQRFSMVPSRSVRRNARRVDSMSW